jgi:hypothetical protein
MMPTRISPHVLASLALSTLALSDASAANLAFEATAGAGHSDNIRRTSVDEQGEDIAMGGLQFSLDQRSPRLETDLVGDFAYYDYLDDTFDSELLGNFAGNARIALVPERLAWIFADNFGQVLNDPFTPATPENRENINYFTTGPDATLAFGSQMRLHLGARYALTTYEDSLFDSESKSGEIGLNRLLSSASSLGLQGRVQDVEYDETALNANYTLTEAFLRYDADGVRTFLTLDLGYTKMDRDAAAQSEDGLLVRLDLSRRLSASSTASLSAGREFSSTGATFASTQSAGGVSLETAPGRQSVQPFTRDYASLGWTFDRNRTGLSLFGSWNEQSYDGQPLLDQKLTSLSASLRRDLSPATTLLLDAGYVRGQFEQPDVDYGEVTAGVSFSWQLGRHVLLNLTYDHADRDSDLADGDYTENRYWLSIGYRYGEPRATPLPRQFAIDAANPPET